MLAMRFGKQIARAAFVMLMLAQPGSAWARDIVLPSHSFFVDSTSSAGVSFTISGTVTSSDTLSIGVTGKVILNGADFSTNAAGIVVLAGNGSVPGDPAIDPTNPFDVGSLLLTISGAGSIPVFPST